MSQIETTTVFSVEEITLELQRVLTFTLFKNSPTLSRFLEYIVSEAVNKREQYIKEYSIAVNVLNRPPTFNSHDDAVVRIHAGRLRRTLNEYYLTEGIHNPVFIQIPKGCYIPQFLHMENAEANNLISHAALSAPTKPTVAVFPFKSTPSDKETNMLSLIFREELSAELSGFHDISVIGYYSTDMIAKINQNILEAGKLAGADYIITGNIHYTDKSIRVRVVLLVTATGEVMMTKLVDKEAVNGLQEIQDEVIQCVVAEASGYYNFILQETAKAATIKVSNNIVPGEGVYKYY